MTIIPQMAEVGKAAEPEIIDANKVKELIDRTVVRNNAEMQTAVGWIAEIKDKWEAVDAKRKSFVDPLRKVVEEINGFFKPALEALKTAEDGLKDKVKDHIEACAARRDDLLVKVQVTETLADRQKLVTQAAALVPAKVDGLSIRETWEGEVADMGALVDWAISNDRRDLLTVDIAALKALTKAAARDPGIPGWRATVRRGMVITSAKVKR